MPSFALASSSRATDSSWSPAWWASSPRDRRSRTSSRVDASSSATLASSSSAWYDSADGGDAGAGDLHVLVGLDAGDADGAGHLAVHQHRHAAGQQRLHGRGDEGGTAAVDHLLEGLGLAAADGGVAGLLGGDIGAEGRAVSMRRRPSRWPPSSATAMVTPQPLASASFWAASRMALTSVRVSTGFVFMGNSLGGTAESGRR